MDDHMPTHRASLPQTQGRLMLTDSGIETDVIFGAGRDLPGFAVFPLVEDAQGRAILDRYYREHLDVAAAHGLGYVMETPSWRSNLDWGTSLGYAQDALDALDRAGVAFLVALRDVEPRVDGPVQVSGLIGPRGDLYQSGTAMTTEGAEEYHAHQVRVLADAGVDLISACTLAYAAEGLGIALAARDCAIPVVLYFTVETDGRLPDGSSLRGAIEAIDTATGDYVSYYGINCAHPDHIAPVLDDEGDWLRRIGALRGNASRMSHAELDEMTELDSGDPADLAHHYLRLMRALPNVTVLGGCCGTDVRHIRAIASAVTSTTDDRR
jgi:homocysteine S-methyltransferase